MKHIRRISRCPTLPVRDVLRKRVSDLRVVPNDIVFAQRTQPGLRPITHGHHDGLLVHFELARFREMQASLPSVTESVRPLSRKAVLLVPYILLCPEPTLPAKRQYQLQYIGVSLTIGCLLFDIQYERTRIAQYPKKLLCPRQKPLYVLVWLDTTVR